MLGYELPGIQTDRTFKPCCGGINMKKLDPLEIKHKRRFNECELCIIYHLEEAKKKGIDNYIQEYIKLKEV